MPKPSCLAAAAALLFVTAPALAGDASPWSFSGGVWGLSDYVWRGVSQTQEDPTWKLEGLIEHESGFYVGGEFYGVDFTPPGADYDDGISWEGNVYVGWTREFSNDMSLDVDYTRVFYPGSRPGYNSNFNELEVIFGFAGHYTATAVYSDDTVNLGHSAWYWRLGGEWELGDSGVTLGAGAGLFDLGSELGGSYRDFELSLGREFGPVSLKLSWFDTSGYNDTLAESLGERHLAGSRVVLAAGFTF